MEQEKSQTSPSSSLSDKWDENQDTDEEEGTSKDSTLASSDPTQSIKPAPKSTNLSETSRKEYVFVFCAGLCLSFNSGYINGACLSGLLTPDGTKQSVSAFTGAYTGSALQLAGGDASGFSFQISMILSFICGAFATGAINPRGKPHQLGPQYGPTFLLGSALLVAASLFSEIKPESRGLFFFAAAANGLQNGMSSMYSGNLIRSSHYTGTSTDIGLIAGQAFRGNYESLWKLWVLLGLTISFWTGGFMSFHATSHFRTHSLVFNACFFFLIGVSLIIFVAVQQSVSIWQAATGSWTWKNALKRLSVQSAVLTKDGENPSEDFLLNLFDVIDEDGSGTIEEDELYIALKKAGMKVSKKGIKALMAMADENNDGEISREEWKMMVHGIQDEEGS